MKRNTFSEEKPQKMPGVAHGNSRKAGSKKLMKASSAHAKAEITKYQETEGVAWRRMPKLYRRERNSSKRRSSENNNCAARYFALIRARFAASRPRLRYALQPRSRLILLPATYRHFRPLLPPLPLQNDAGWLHAYVYIENNREEADIWPENEVSDT